MSMSDLFLRQLFSNHCHRSLLMCAHRKRHPDMMRADPGVRPSSSTSISCTPHHWSRLLSSMGLPMMTEALEISPSYGLGNRATPCRPLHNLRSWLVYRTKVFIRSLASFRCWRAYWWMSCRWSTSLSQGSRSSRPNTRLPGVNPIVSWVDALYARRKRCNLSSQPSGGMWQLSAGAPR
jgi:hypothetical protein